MSSPRLPRDRRRTASIVLSAISLAIMTILVVWVSSIMLTVSGSSTMIAILPWTLFYLTSWIWAALALVALVLGATSLRPLLPCVLAAAVLVEILFGFFLLPTL